MFKNTIGRQIAMNAFIPVVAAMFFLEFITFMNTRRLLKENKKEEVLQLKEHTKQLRNSYFLLLQDKMQSQKTQLLNQLDLIAPQLQEGYPSEIDLNSFLDDREGDGLHLFLVNYNGVIIKSSDGGPKSRNIELPANRSENNRWFSDLFFSAQMQKFGILGFREVEGADYLLGGSFMPLFKDSVAQHMIQALKGIKAGYPLVKHVHVFNQSELILSTRANYMPGNREAQIAGKMLNKPASTFHKEVSDDRIAYYMRFGSPESEVLEKTVIELEIDEEYISEALQSELYKYLLLLLFTVVAVGLILLNRVRSITAPIKRIVASASQIKENDYYERVRFSGNQELTGLVKEFNNLLDKLEEKNEKVLSLNASLDKQESQNKNIQENNFHLKEELKRIKTDNNFNTNYVLRLKENLLRPEAQLHQYMDEAFVMMRPKGVVGGDFYWFTKVNQHIIFIVGDSTGHGIPGGVISFFGLGMTQHIINKQEITDPAEFLNTLEDEIDSLLHKGENEFFFDGMDVAVVSLDTKNNSLAFAGAKQPLFIIRDEKVKELKGAQYPIGKYYENKKKFTTQTLALQQDDKVYLFTDGYIAQTGDINKKRYSEERFKNLLINASELPFREQKQYFVKQLDQWMGMEEQVDDILILGFNPQHHQL